ncbi:hypothetical protein GOODEAATRI_014803, partial [Goodea atripinnis]
VSENSRIQCVSLFQVHFVQVSGCRHGDGKRPHGDDEDKQAGRYRQSLSRQVTSLPSRAARSDACDITGGLYLKIPQKVALAQYLLVSVAAVTAVCSRWSLKVKSVCVLCEQWVFLPDSEQRSQLVLPPPAHVDYRAACFCHRNLIEIGYVCSVCLSSECRTPSQETDAFQK